MNRARTLRKVVTGGQTGVDQAALRAARDVGLAIGGWCPPGRVCEGGTISADLPLTPTARARSTLAPDVPRSQRTAWNVRDADATLVLAPAGLVDAGTAWAVAAARHYGRPFLACDPDDPGVADAIAAWLDAERVNTLNVAGPSEGTAPGIGARVYRSLLEVFRSMPRSEQLKRDGRESS